MLLVSETLPDQTFNPVSVNGPLQNLFCHRCSQAGIGLAIGPEQYGEAAIRRSAGVLKHPLELRRFK